jgi:serine/threonine-protein kinase
MVASQTAAACLAPEATLLSSKPPKVPLERPRRRSKPATLSPGDRIGPWRVDGELGRGGMGSVYAVTHCGFGKRAALKLAHRSMDAAIAIETFVREARVVHLVNHPGVADVFATGTYDCRPYLAMERLHGKTLGEHLEDEKVTRADKLDILFEICRVLSSAHAAGVVHRDLKLDNVFICDGGQVKLLDWGVARIVGERDPLAGMIAGTLTYVAPEQISADELKPASDIYSLGVLAYVMLCGTAPFKHERDLDLIRMHLVAPPPRPANHWAEIPAALEQQLLRMLAKDPEARPSIDEVMRGFVAARRELEPRAATQEIEVPKRPVRDFFARMFTSRSVVGAVVAAGAIVGGVLSLLG